MAKTKLPKKILGLKVPKKLRKAAFVKTLLDDPVGREILAGAVVAAASAAAAALSGHRPTARQVGEAGAGVADRGTAAAEATKDLVQDAAGALAAAITKMATRLSPEATAIAEARPEADEAVPSADNKARSTQPRKNAKKDVPVVRATH
jgi:hypothetical protein